LLALCLLVAMVAPAFAADGTAYGLNLAIDNENPALGDSVTVTASFTVDGTDQSTIPDGYTLSIWYQNDSDWVTPVNGSSTTTSTDITLDSNLFTDGKTYTVEAALYDSDWNTLASDSVTFTVGGSTSTTPTYGLSLTADTSTPALGNSVTISASFTVDGETVTSVPDGCTLSIWYGYDNDGWSTPVNASTDTTSTTISVDSSKFTDGSTYTVKAELYDSNWAVLASGNVSFTVTGDNTSGTTDTYAVTITPSATTCEQNESLTFEITVTKNGETIDLTSQSDVYLWVWADSWADGHSDGLTDCSISPNTGLSNSVTITFPSEGTYYIACNLQDSSYTDILRNTDVATITVTESTATASEDITTGSLSCDFMRGMDLSTFYTNWTNGAVYYDYEGNEYSQANGNAVDFFQFLYDKCGVNWVRLRVWNDPYDEDGNPYGGGNNDVKTAAIIGKWASDAGMSVLIDFHYSDFWADPGRQLAPKAWADMDIDEKVEALYDYTYESLEYLLDAGVNVGMVQVGNETNGALCGEAIDWSEAFDASTNQTWQNIVKLFKSGSSAVRDISDEYGTTIKVALHFTNPNNANPSWYAGLLDDAGVDYDAMGISYYMYWHGTMSNLQNEIETIASTYGKEVFIAETAYPYTSENFDDLGNQVTSFDDFDMNANLYAISEAGQEAALTAILNTAANSNGCTGMFYWEPAWTALDEDTLDSGTGWATKWASDYISYSMSASEGSSFDNQTLFDSTGHPLAALSYYVDYLNGSQVEHTAGETVVENEVAATCTTDGSYDEVVYCTVCGEEISRDTVTVAATGHNYDYDTPAYTWSDDYSTCTVTFTCSAGDATTTYECKVTSSGTAATCTAKGSMTYVAVCTVNGLTYANIKTVETDMIAHTWDDGVVTKEATADEAGEITYTCTVCGETYTESIAALGNDADDEEDADGTSDSSKTSSSSSSSKSKTSSNSSESETTSVKTGDNASLILWVVLAGIALVVLGAILLMKRRSGSRK
ncbi:MAG: glycosyl hydrolase 53 family protein, partial [Clostridiales bacterium]|nr:glycosyl hydrolase 53 family protein [Clostridiales bacterium]